jgi:hypothetical protein
MKKLWRQFCKWFWGPGEEFARCMQLAAIERARHKRHIEEQLTNIADSLRRLEGR